MPILGIKPIVGFLNCGIKFTMNKRNNPKRPLLVYETTSPHEAPPGYAEHSGEIAALMGWFMLRHLGRLYHEFKGDFVLAMVLGELAHHNIRRHFSLGGPLSKRTIAHGSRPMIDDLEPCNAFSLSAATGIPRETIRRKITLLVKRGWLKKHFEGGYVITASVSEHFANEINLQSFLDFIATSEELRKILED